jgi:DNA/RNA endonuclease YhcR with UshA esterase domain
MRIRLLAFVILVAAAASVSAHHSFAATYEVGKQVKIEGKIVQFVYRNPHSFVHVEAPDADGTMQRWAVEWGGTAQLAQQGVKRDSLKIGEKVQITGRPSRVPNEYRMLMVTLKAEGVDWGRNATDVVD